MKVRLKKLAFFAAFTAPMGANFLAIPLGGVQLTLFRIAVIVLALGIIQQNFGKITLFRRGNRFSIGFMFFWLIYATISVFWSRDLSNYVRVLFFLFVGFLSIVICGNVFETKEDYYLAAEWLEYGILLQAAIGWYEIFTRDYRFFTMTGINYDHFVLGKQRIPLAMMGNANDFATLMLLGVVLALFAFQRSSGRAAKGFHLAAMVNFAVLIYAGRSRAVLIGLILAAAFILVSLKYGNLVILLGIPVVPIVFSKLIASIRSILQFDFHGTESDGKRLGLIRSGFAFLKKTFGFGVGNGQIEYWMERGAGYYTGGTTSMHNWWMEILTSYGVVVFFGYILFYCKLFLDNYRVMRHSEDKCERSFSRMVCAALVGFVIASVASSSNMVEEWLWFFWALCIGYQGMIDERIGPEKEE